MKEAPGGFLQSTLRLPARAVRRLIGYRSKNELILTKDLREPERGNWQTGLEIRHIAPEHRDVLSAFHERSGVDAAQRDRIRKYFDHGHSGWLGFVDGDLIGYLWWTDNSAPEKHRHPHLRVYGIQLAAHDVYMVDFYIAPGQRGSGRALEFFSRAQQDLRDRGYERAYGIVSVEKTPAKWVYLSLGWEIVRLQRSHTLFKRVGLCNGKAFSLRECKF